VLPPAVNGLSPPPGRIGGTPARPAPAWRKGLIGTIRIGHFFGIEVSIHWSWIFIFFFITGTFAEGILNQSFPEWTKAQLWSVALAISIVFFLSILLHELSHSLVARRFGIPVSSITLLIYGGVS